MNLLPILIAIFFSFLSLAYAEESCLEIYKKQAQENSEYNRIRQDRQVHGEVTLSGNGKTYPIPNGNITFSGQTSYTYEVRNDEQIALELLNDEFILKLTDSEAYHMLTHLQDKFSRKEITLTIPEIQEYIKQGFADYEFCKDGKPNKRAGQIVRYAKRQIKDEKINNEPRKPSPPKLADDFNTERDVAGKKKETIQN